MSLAKNNTMNKLLLAFLFGLLALVIVARLIGERTGEEA